MAVDIKPTFDDFFGGMAKSNSLVKKVNNNNLSGVVIPLNHVS